MRSRLKIFTCSSGMQSCQDFLLCETAVTSLHLVCIDGDTLREPNAVSWGRSRFQMCSQVGVIAVFSKKVLHDVGYWSLDMIINDIDVIRTLQSSGWYVLYKFWYFVMKLAEFLK